MTTLPASEPFGSPSLVVRCFNVKYSPNLGDGLLSECLESALIDHGADKATGSIDLAARTKYGDAMLGRGAALKALDAMPDALRQSIVRLPLYVKSITEWRPHFAGGLDGAQAVALGGGNLISDLDLNFPTKLSVAITEAEMRNLPIAIYACGVGSHWSALGLRWLRTAFSSPNMRAVFVRDSASKSLWDEKMGAQTGHEAVVVRDPGLLAARYYPAPKRVSGRRPVAGLGIISHVAIRYHSKASIDKASLGVWYVDVARRLIAKGFQVRVFTNGGPEDKADAVRLESDLRSLGSEEEITFLSQETPAELCAHIADFDVLIAFRMHAIIAAYSYGVPAIALAWDHKLDAFMASVGRRDFVRDVASTPPEACVALALDIAQAGLPQDQHDRILEEAHADVGQLYSALSKKVA
jgi:polysaccharide pyruvyl transferase WcaK-like protein